MKVITRRLRVLRVERELSQMEVAIRASIKHYRYWRIEAGYAEPTPEELGRLSRVLKTTPEEILADPVGAGGAR